jgi:hypothetical protein
MDGRKFLQRSDGGRRRYRRKAQQRLRTEAGQLEFLDEHRGRMLARAREHFAKDGRGAVRIDLDGMWAGSRGEPVFPSTYVPLSAAPQGAEDPVTAAMRTYDPEKEAVVVFLSTNGEQVWGWHVLQPEEQPRPPRDRPPPGAGMEETLRAFLVDRVKEYNPALRGLRDDHPLLEKAVNEFIDRIIQEQIDLGNALPDGTWLGPG